MLLEVALPPGSTRPASSGLLAASPSEQGVDVSVRAVDGDVL